MRKAFNFYKSYYDVAKELSDKDALAFLMAVFEKQFSNKDPDLKGMAKFAYLSQEHSILSQVKGYVDKCKGLEINPFEYPTEPPQQPPTEPPATQEKEKGEEQVEGKVEEKQAIVSFSEFWDLYDKKVGEKDKLEKKWLCLTDAERLEAMDYIPKYKLSQPDKKFRKNPEAFLNQKAWNNELIGYKETANKTATLPIGGTIHDNHF